MIKSIQPYFINENDFVVFDKKLLTRSLYINCKLSRVDQHTALTLEFARERAKFKHEQFLEKQK